MFCRRKFSVLNTQKLYFTSYSHQIWAWEGRYCKRYRKGRGEVYIYCKRCCGGSCKPKNRNKGVLRIAPDTKYRVMTWWHVCWSKPIHYKSTKTSFLYTTLQSRYEWTILIRWNIMIIHPELRDQIHANLKLQRKILSTIICICWMLKSNRTESWNNIIWNHEREFENNLHDNV